MITLFFNTIYANENGITFNFAFFKEKTNAEIFLKKYKELELVVIDRENGVSVRSKCLPLSKKESYILQIEKLELKYFIVKEPCIINQKLEIIKEEVIKNDQNNSEQFEKKIETFYKTNWQAKEMKDTDFSEKNSNKNILQALSLLEKNNLKSFDYFNNIIENNELTDDIKNFIAFYYGKFSMIDPFDYYYQKGKFNLSQRFYFIYGLSKNPFYYDMAINYLYDGVFDPLLGTLVAQELYLNDKKNLAEQIIDKAFDLNKNNSYILLTYAEIKYYLQKISKEERNVLINKIKHINKEAEVEQWIKKMY
jgi:hypothetical protein